jgi:hypothetical protein
MAASKQSFAEKDCAAPQPSVPDLKILGEITRSAQYVAGASGAALILSDGKIMSCRACSGSLAPPVGTTLNTETGFTAACVRTATVVRCDDTQSDPRVDGSICVELGIGSILAVPIFNGLDVTGVLEVLSNTPRNFTDKHAVGLQLLGRLVETVCNYDGASSLASGTPDVKLRESESASALADLSTRGRPIITCLSCRHPNPHDSQFCNRCGVILFSFLGPEDASADRNPSSAIDSNGDEDLKQLRKVITGNGLPATWSEISKRLLADQTARYRSQPAVAATDQSTTTVKDASKDIGQEGRAEETTRPQTRIGTSVRRKLWL